LLNLLRDSLIDIREEQMSFIEKENQLGFFRISDFWKPLEEL